MATQAHVYVSAKTNGTPDDNLRPPTYLKQHRGNCISFRLRGKKIVNPNTFWAAIPFQISIPSVPT